MLASRFSNGSSGASCRTLIIFSPQGWQVYRLLRSICCDPSLIFLVLYLRLATPIPFLVGLSIMVLSIVMVGVFEFIMMKKGES